MFPKWKERSKVGIYLGRSPHHASTVPLILNTQTGLVSPQFHVIYDDNFDTVIRDRHFESLWQYKAKLQSQSDAPSAQGSTDVVATDKTASTASGLHDYQSSHIPNSLNVPWDSPPASVPLSEGGNQPTSQSTAETDTDAAPSRQMQSSEGDVPTEANRA